MVFWELTPYYNTVFGDIICKVSRNELLGKLFELDVIWSDFILDEIGEAMDQNDDSQDQENSQVQKHLTEQELEAMRAAASVPDVRPCDFDLTLNGWMARISLWGKVKIRYSDPEFKVNKEITVDQFLAKMGNPDATRDGKFDVDRKDINKVELFREYGGIRGKIYRESFMVTVDLKPELKKALGCR